jgi:hypothetical protein
MKNPIKKGSLLYLLLLVVEYWGFGQPAIPITIETDHPLARIQPTLNCGMVCQFNTGEVVA